MNRMPSSRKRQQGAVAIIVGLSIVILVGMLALVVDLGHLYIAKTELQNAADAAALAGAKELDGTTDGVTAAVAKAIDLAALNEYDFSKPVVITDADISFGSSPTGPWDDGADPSNKFFIKVDTGVRELDTWFAPVLGLISGNNFDKTRTFGMAVAGGYLQDIAPLAVCAIDENDDDPETGTGNYGYIKGVGYNLAGINKIIAGLAAGTPIWLHPTATTSEDCEPNFASTDAFLSFLCQGKSAISIGAKVVIGNTGSGGESHNKAVNTRFGWNAKYYDKKLTAQLCAPDLNVMQFGADGFWGTKPPANTMVADWLTYTPTFKNNYDLTLDPSSCSWSLGGDKVNVEFGQGTPLAKSENCPNDIYVGATWNPDLVDLEEGVLGSYVKPTQTDLSGKLKSDYKDYKTTAYFAGLATSPNNYRYPPYTTGTTPQPNRRIMNMVIVDCRAPSGGACAEIDKLQIGQFFLPVEAGIPQQFYAEYVRRISSAKDLKSEIRLYK